MARHGFLLFYKTCPFMRSYCFIKQVPRAIAYFLWRKNGQKGAEVEVMLCVFEQIIQDVGEDAAGEVVINLDGGIDAIVELEVNFRSVGLGGDCGMSSVGLKGANALD